MADPLLFQKTLQDLIKGIRGNKKDPSAYISKAIAEIKTELKSNDPFLKAEAIRKLTYLQMVGYNVSWAAFSIVEVMSQSRFAHRRIGYLAANQTFDDGTDVILLTTNLFKKEFASGLSANQYEVGLAINCLANIATKELARDCISDLTSLMNSTKPYIRKKAILAMYKLYIKFPQGLRLTFDKLKDRLDDAESSVISTAVNVICELANKNPKNYLAMAPKFFKLLTTSSNNWMLIKVVKLLGSLVSEEPRLARKLLEPLATIIQNTGAKSLQYECIYTITEALPFSRREDGSEAKNAAQVIAICSSYLKQFIEDADQNLKYLGLVGLCHLMKSSPRSVVEHRDLVLGCLTDDDVTIRIKALELLAGIASKKSLVDLVHHLLSHAQASEGSYRDEIIRKVLWMCRKDKYSLVPDFIWYTRILLQLGIMQPGSSSSSSTLPQTAADSSTTSSSTSSSSTTTQQAAAAGGHGLEVADQLIEIAMRVDRVRPVAVECLLTMLLNEDLVLGHARSTVVEVLRAAAWIIGEYTEIVTKIMRDKPKQRKKDEEDSLDGEEDEEEEDETAFWIEGGEEDGDDNEDDGEGGVTMTRSAWRGQPLFHKILQVLCHPRSSCPSLLPITVQMVYLQAMLKLLVRASLDCSVDEVADLLGVIRPGLAPFLQSMDLEVQERATTLRYLLVELGILPINWETQAQVKTTSTQQTQLSQQTQQHLALLDLLQFASPTSLYSDASLRQIDLQGARQAVRQRYLFKALVQEKFYAVHSKAQRKVPLPTEGCTNLHEAFNASALNKLMKIELGQGFSLNNICFVKEATNTYSNQQQQSKEAASVGSNGNNKNKAASSAFDDIFSTDGGSSVTTGVTTKITASSLGSLKSQLSKKKGSNGSNNQQQAEDEEDDIFMLGGSNNQLARSNKLGGGGGGDLIPLSKILGDYDEMTAGHKKKSKDKGKDKKNSKKQRQEQPAVANNAAMVTSIDQREMLPAGAAIDDDDEDDNKKKRKKGSSKQPSQQLGEEDIDEDEENLEKVDITKPLRPEERLVAPTHRVVPEVTAATIFKEKKSDKKSKLEKEGSKSSKDKKKNKTKDKSKDNKEQSAYLEADLLALDWPTTAAAASSSSTTMNLLDADQPDNSEAAADPYAEIDAIATTSSSSAALQPATASAAMVHPHDLYYHSYHSSRFAEMNYAITVLNGEATLLQVTMEVRNLCLQGSAITAQIHCPSKHPLVKKIVPLTSTTAGGSYLVANRLPAREETIVHLLQIQLASPCTETMALASTLQLTVTGAQQEVMTISLPMKIYCTVACTPYPMEVDKFAEKMSKRSSKWTKRSVNIAYTLSNNGIEAVFQKLAGFLRAAIVEIEQATSSKKGSSCMMASKTLTGGKVYYLCKTAAGSSTPTMMSIELKCLGSSEHESLAVAVSIVQALESEVF